MKHLFIFEEYMDKFGEDGGYHDIFDIDPDWILKMPKKAEYSISDFDKHIKVMLEFPEIFPQVKRLSKKRAVIEKLDTQKAKDEIKYITNVLAKEYNEYEGERSMEVFTFTERWIIDSIFQSNFLKKLLVRANDEICSRWLTFINLIDLTFKNYELTNELDLHSGNFGIDKQGNIKLLDF